MFSVHEAEECLLHNTFTLTTEKVSLKYSIGRVLAEDVLADRPAPPYNRVAMDGIAILCEECPNATATPCENIARAGIPQIKKIQKGSYIEVSTGAILPENTNAVIPYEDLTFTGEVVTWGKNPTPFLNVHTEGSDYQKNDILLPKGARIALQDISLLASVGKDILEVVVTPTIAIVTTGDEIIPHTSAPLVHQIRASNSIQVEMLLTAHTFTNITIYHSPDSSEQLVQLLDRLAQEYDVIICIGGISKGKFDVVRSALQILPVTTHIDGIAQRPGKPFFFGTLHKAVLFALPGNPLASTVTARRYIIPFLDACIGNMRPPIYRILGENYSFSKNLTRFLFAMQDPQSSHLIPLPDSSSGNFFSLVNSLGFFELPAHRTDFIKGEELLFYPWG